MITTPDVHEARPERPAAPPIPRHPLRELLARYRAVFGAAWSLRHQLAGPARLTDEVAFLPAALSLQETPVHPAPRRVALAVCLLFIIALAWSILGHVDIAAVAPGRIIVSDRTKTIQPLERSVVQRVLVQDGDMVKEGQPLIELDPTTATADKTTAQDQLNNAASESVRTRRMLLMMDKKPFGPTEVFPPDWSREEVATAEARQAAEWADINAKTSRLSADIAQRQAEITTAQEMLAKLDATIPLARQRESDLQSLSAEGYVPLHNMQDKARERIEMERDAATQRAKLVEARAAVQTAEDARMAYIAETRRSLNERRDDADLKRQQAGQEHAKAAQRERLTVLKAPVEGTVQQLAIHTVGGVVTEAQALMVIVPKEAQMTAEVTLENQDIGFVHAGQAAEIKLDTFPYTRYGTIPAEVQKVAADAVVDEKKGPLFPAMLVLKKEFIDVDGKNVRLSPGMSLTAEIKTGNRSVIDYLLSPIQTATRESLRER